MKSLKLTTAGLYWLKVNIASEYGLDKETYNCQAQWVNDHIDTLEEEIHRADNKFGYSNAVEALRCYQRDEEVHYIMPMDASNQAIQMYGVLTSDKKTASMGGISTGETRIDLYGELAKELNELYKTDIFDRSICKKPLMVTLYGSSNGHNELLENIKMSEAEFLAKVNSSLEIEEAFGQVMMKLVPYCMNVMDIIQSLNNKDIGTYTWTMPDGAKVKYDVKTNMDMNLQKTSKSGKTFSVTLTSETYAPSAHNKGMAPNLIHSVDAYFLREVVRKMGNSFITTIHDSYSVHPNEIEKLREVYTQTLIEINESNLLQDLLTDIAERFIPFTKSNTLTEADIQASIYHIS